MVYLCTNALQTAKTNVTMKKVRVEWKNGEQGFTMVFDNDWMTCLETGKSQEMTSDEFDRFIDFLSDFADIESLDEYEMRVVFQTTVHRFFPDHGVDRPIAMDPVKDIFLDYDRSEAFNRHYELFREAKSTGGSTGEYESVRPEDAIHKVRHIDGTQTEIRTIARVIKITKEQ